MSAISLVLLSFLYHLVFLTAQPPNFKYYRCFGIKGNYTNTSTYQTNLNILLSDLASNAQIDYGFYNRSRGKNPDRVRTIGLCRGDVKPIECQGCLKNASLRLPQVCPNQKEAVGGYDDCMLRYSNQSIYGVMESNFWVPLWNVNNATDQDKFDQVVNELLDRLRMKAANGDSLLKYAAANESGPSFQTVYGAVQCTPDLSQQDCVDCLVEAISHIPDCCSTKRGGRVIMPSCNIRYENYRFFVPVAQDSPPSPSPSPRYSPPTLISKGKSSKSKSFIVIVVPPIIVVAILLLSSVFIYFRNRKPKETSQIDEADQIDDEIKPTESLQLDFDTIRLATDNFSDVNKLGQGGFGPVYKGKLYNGEEVAVKRLSMNSGQGDIEFKNEVMLVAKLQHRNLVRLLGFCLERRERLLVYEFLPNKSLDYLLFDPAQRAQLDWEIRYKIIVGIARGLLYLHEDSRLRIIHRDIKTNNILLDEELNPKISDFGMARLFVIDQTQSNTSKIVGTHGYIAPEYLIHGQFSMKSDVFSFGVLVLEIISGKKNSATFHGENSSDDLISFAWKTWRERAASNIIDPVLSNGSRNEILRCIHIGLLCVQENVADRPTMALVSLMLSSHSLSLPLPSQPPFLPKSKSLSEMNSREYSSSGATRSSERRSSNSATASKNEVSITELYPR
ncbi:cysteine-rich receptor-like protein kinase 44 isoform X1 [Prosopis cineraria]|uniref:cysteine-rich receptor-like protein kinase 44 isoform X1 n=1 Tax=Prosopis cineraria TaxID=364024 RepID=UPI00240FA6C7|nr:cysteine-rich receptor-like protein kinase 44 isoform X1 [Prosopis cineraria]